MDLNERMKQVADDGLRWFPEVDKNIAHTALGLSAEAGEVSDWVKKFERFTLDWNGLLERVPEEIIDVIVYALKLASQLGIDVEKEYDKKRDYNEKRFGSRAYSIRTPGRAH